MWIEQNWVFNKPKHLYRVVTKMPCPENCGDNWPSCHPSSAYSIYIHQKSSSIHLEKYIKHTICGWYGCRVHWSVSLICFIDLCRGLPQKVASRLQELGSILWLERQNWNKNEISKSVPTKLLPSQFLLYIYMYMYRFTISNTEK
jgi:hypothetical protein